VTAPIVLKVGTFNIEYGGTVVDFDQIVAAVEASDADVLGVEESWGHIPRLARAAGWRYYSVRTGIISRYPLIDPPGSHGRYVFVEPSPGRVVAVQNVHLPSSPYSPDRIFRGATLEETLQVEREVRLAALRPFLTTAKHLREQKIPVFLVGDFNAPSHRDWTEATVGMRPHVLYPVRWPVSVAVERVGFHDSYRVVHPNPVSYPGLTWWAARPRSETSWNPGPHAPEDRIDMVYAAGAKTLGSVIMGEPSSPDVDIAVWPWGTDHRAVISTFSVKPAPPPVHVAVSRRLVESGDELAVTYHSPSSGGEHVAVVTHGGDPVADAIADQAAAGTDGELSFDTTGWTAGSYDVALLDGADTVLSMTRGWIRDLGAGPTIATGSPTYSVGDPIDVHWSNVRGDRWDWIGIYRRGADPYVAWYLLWIYTDARVEGTVMMDRASVGPWPLDEGRYTVYILRDDGYQALAGADFEIT
jgi:endonuclease/exonuclease/phosphatase family metal-dependent hydrolase